MPALIQQESGGRAGIAGQHTPYGVPLGMTQMLPSTAKGVAENLGWPYRPDLLTGTSPEAQQYQRALGEAYLREGLKVTGNVRDALRYYHGGPNRALWGPKTNAYADAILSRLRGM
jgi:soluble lytic murein transglycosylase-like protein